MPVKKKPGKFVVDDVFEELLSRVPLVEHNMERVMSKKILETDEERQQGEIARDRGRREDAEGCDRASTGRTRTTASS